MPQSHAKVYLHIVFSTKNRDPFLSNDDVRNEMHTYLGGTCNKLGCQILIVGGVADHIHILCMYVRTMTIGDLVGDIKRDSSKWVKRKGGILSKFAWQNGYSVFSVGLSEIERLRYYIAKQEGHHKKVTFQDEMREYFKKYNVDYDERYVWD